MTIKRSYSAWCTLVWRCFIVHRCQVPWASLTNKHHSATPYVCIKRKASISPAFIYLATFNFNPDLLKRCCDLYEMTIVAENPFWAFRELLLKEVEELYLIDATGLLQFCNSWASEEAFKSTQIRRKITQCLMECFSRSGCRRPYTATCSAYAWAF